MIELQLPDPSLILLIGPAGAGKSTFAARHFLPTEIISSDHCRALICDDAAAQHLNAETFCLVHHLARLRVQQGKLTVIDATNLEQRARRPFLRLARRWRVPVVALVFEVALATCQAQNQARSRRVVPPEVVQKQFVELAQAQAQLPREGYAGIYRLNESHLATVTVTRTKQPRG